MANTVRVGVGVTGAKKAESDVDRFRNKFEGLQKQGAKGIAIGAGVAATTAAFGLIDRAISGTIGFLGDAVAAGMAEEKSIAGLNASLKANIAGWDGNTEAIEKTLKARMDLGFSDDEQRESLKLLVAATGDSTRALDVQRVAMDLARFKNISLAAAGEALTKVEAGQFRILKNLGIQLPKNATAEQALAAVMKVTTGAAEAEANTVGGKLLKAQVKLGERMEDLGTRIMPLVADGAGLVVEGFDRMGRGVDKVSAAFDSGVEGFQTWHRLYTDLLTLEDDATLRSQRAAIVRGEAAVAQVKVAQAAAAANKKSAAEIALAMKTGHDAAMAIVRKTPGDLADALRKGRKDWQEEVNQLGGDLENEMSKTAEIAAINAALIGENIARGLKSKDPVVRAQADETVRILRNRLNALTEDARTSGANIGTGLAGGLASSIPRVEQAAKKVAKAVTKYIKVSSPAEAGPLSLMGGPEGMGKKVAELFGAGLTKRMPDLGAAMGNGLRLAGAASGGGSAPISHGGGKNVTHVHVHLNGREIGEAVAEHEYWSGALAGGSTLRG